MKIKLHQFTLAQRLDAEDLQVKVIPPQINIQEGSSVKVDEGVIVEIYGETIEEIFKQASNQLAITLLAVESKGQIDDSTLKERLQGLYASLK